MTGALAWDERCRRIFGPDAGEAVDYARLLGGALLAAGAFQALRAAASARREISGYRAAGKRLGVEWASIRGPAGAGRLRLRARVGGPAASSLPPVVLVHGYGVGSGYLVPLASVLAKHARVYAPELPGHGRSDHDLRPLSIPELGRALAAWMDARGLHHALLVGHSLGCQVVAEVAVRRPDLAAGLVLVGPTSDPAARTAARTLVRGLGTLFFERPGYMLIATLDYRRAGARVLAAEMRQMVAHRVEDLLPRVAAPVRVVHGGRDFLVPRPWAGTVARLAGAPVPALVPGWAHAVHYDEPGAVARAVLDLARRVHPPGLARRRRRGPGRG